MNGARKENGKIRVIYKDCPIFGPLPERAALVPTPSDLQMIYLAVHELLMRVLVGNDDDLRSAAESQEAIGSARAILTGKRAECAYGLEARHPPFVKIQTLAKRGPALAEPLFVHEI
jgi:hypothetical protein